MKHVIGSLAAALTLALAITVPAYGQQRQATPQADVVAAAFTAEVTGQVQNVDPQTGVLTLQTTDGAVNVRFLPAAVQTIKPGDTVTVAFGLVKEPPSASPSTSPGSKSK